MSGTPGETIAGTAICPSCSAVASVVVQDGELHLTCDACLFEMRGEAHEQTDAAGREG